MGLPFLVARGLPWGGESRNAHSHMTPAERLALLEGAWHLVRVIRHSDGTRARFVGHAVWLAEGPVLRCREDGVLTQAGRTMPATRETLWR
ncbi:DUF6314 family protein, partial [Jannaschia aquimarina]